MNEFTVKEYDAEHMSVTVEYQGRPLKLALKRAAPVVAALPVPQPGNGAVPAANRPAPVVQVPATSQQLQQVRDEINRRRALRSQPPTTPAGATPTPTPAPPP